MQYGLRYDMIDQYLPWRSFVADCLRGWTWPFWNPYQHWGYYFSADPQSGAWYPLNWLYALAGGYTVYFNQFDFTLHVILGGLGMFRLARHLSGDARAALIIAITYMLSGFFTGNAQHLTYVISGAWVPIVFHQYLLLWRRPGWPHAIRFALAFFMLLSGGYPAFTIIVAYCLAFMFLSGLWSRRHARNGISAYLRGHAFAALAVCLLGAFVITSVLTSLGYVMRGTAIPLEDAVFNPFSPRCMWSWLYPLWSAREPAYFDTDISMSNLYFGIFGLALFISSILTKPDRRQVFMLLAGLFFLLVSFGGYTPVRGWLYAYVPFMDLFRFPSIFRLFALIPFLLVASVFLSRLLNGNRQARRWFDLAVGLIGLSGVCAIAYTRAQGIGLEGTGGLFAYVNNLAPLQAIQVQALVTVVLAFAWLALRGRIKQVYRPLLVFVMLDLVIAAQLNGPLTVYDRYRTAHIDGIMDGLPDNFPNPGNRPSAEWGDSRSLASPFWRNLSLLRREPGHDGFNSFRMSGYGQLIEEPLLMEKYLSAPLAYLSTSHSFYSDTIYDHGHIARDSSHLYFMAEDSLSVPDPGGGRGQVEVAVFRPGDITLETKTTGQVFLTLKQHFHPGWQVLIDGTEARVWKTNYLFMTIQVPEGSHRITYSFTAPFIKASFIISFASILLCLAVLALAGRRSHSG